MMVAMTETEPNRAYDASNPEHRAWWAETVRQQILDVVDLPEGLTLAWQEGQPVLRRRCESEACDEFDGIHSYGDGCAMARKEPA
jgi:hypothetical protein